MKISKKRLIAGGIAVLAIFITATFSSNWGNATAKKTTEDLKPIIKSVKNNPIEARKQCPIIIKKLRDGIAKLEGNNIETRRLEIIKLISDCEWASQQYQAASVSLGELSKAEPQVPQWHGMRAEAFYKTGNINEAVREARLAVQLAPDNFKWRIQEARILANTALRNRAKHAYQAAIKIAPYDQIQKLQIELVDFLERTDPELYDEASS